MNNVQFKLDHSQFDAVKDEVETLIKWAEDNMRYPTIKVKPQSMKVHLEAIVGAIEDIRTLQQQNEQLDKSWSDGADELNKQIEWRNKRIEKLGQQNKQMKELLSEFGDNNRWTWSSFKGDVIAEWNTNQNGDPIEEVKKLLQSIQGGSSNDN